MKNRYDVIVGNVGTVYCGANKRTAQRTFNAYVKASKAAFGRCANEPVTLIHDNEIVNEFQPANTED